ncbi:MAG TPA: DUF5719 family protein [Acidimicrobiales bacterium]
MSGSAGGRGAPAPRSNGRDPAEPAHLPAGRARRARAERDRRSLVVRLVAVAVLVPALGGAVVVDAARRQPDRPADPRPAPLMPSAAGGSSTWYCAAGTADDGGMADHSVTIVNPGPGEVAATLTVHAGAVAAGGSRDRSSAPEEERVTVPAGGRTDVRLGDVVEAPLAAAVVEVEGGGAVVEHRVRGEHGEDVGPCSTFAADTWHFAWGATTRDAREVVVLFNPFPSSATVDAVFATEDGPREPVRLQGFPVPGRSVVGVDLGDDVARSEHVSATFRVRSGRVVAERLQQHDGSLGLRGLALGLGVPTPGAAWVLADGEASAPAPHTPPPRPGDLGDETDDDETGDVRDEGDDDLRSTERIVVYNPGDERAEVDVEVVPAGGNPGDAPLPFRLSVGAGDHQVLDYGEHDRVEPGGRHATVVRSTDGRPVVVERVAADVGPVPTGDEPSADEPAGDPAARPASLAVAAGARLGATRWVVPSVVAPGGGGTVTYTVFNPTDAPVEVSVDLLDGPGPARPAGVPGTDGAAGAAPAVVPAGAAIEVALGNAEADRALAGVVTAGRPVVVGYAIRAADGRRTSAAPGVPVAAGAVPLVVAGAGGAWGVAAPG